MAKHVLVALVNAKAGREDEFNDWYDHHLQELLAVPGVVAVQRYQLNEAQLIPNQAYKYLTIYEVETDDTAEVIAGLGARSKAAGMTDALDGIPTVGLFSPLGERVTAAN